MLTKMSKLEEILFHTFVGQSINVLCFSIILQNTEPSCMKLILPVKSGDYLKLDTRVYGILYYRAIYHPVAACIAIFHNSSIAVSLLQNQDTILKAYNASIL